MQHPHPAAKRPNYREMISQDTANPESASFPLPSPSGRLYEPAHSEWSEWARPRRPVPSGTGHHTYSFPSDPSATECREMTEEILRLKSELSELKDALFSR
jgi:hypothetical protein